ncbi:MAG: hypothetical protein JW861_05705, partial [Bacteroidales bacterium]|nr:hypothetical protein [Bacteroidales bacterium]
TVVIGSQCWIAQNLNIGTMINGSNGQSDDGIIEKYCFDDNAANCDEYGGLYQWDEMMDYSTTPQAQGICPDGWHLPDDLEYFFLEQHVDSTIDYNTTGYRGVDGGGKLKEAGTTHWQAPNTGATNSSGFTGLPGGYRSTAGSFINLTVSAFFWSSGENGPDAWNRHLSNNNVQVARYSGSKAYGFSVRCISDTDVSNTAPVIPADPSPTDGATDIGIDTTLSWWCADPNGDMLAYDIYLGTESNPPLVQSDHPNTMFYPGTLHYSVTYYWRIVAKDNHGNSQSSPIWLFTTEEAWLCGDLLTDPRDGQSYETVIIGDQCWMAENMDIGAMIPASQVMSDNEIIEKYCYDGDPANCDTYGGLYSWAEAMLYDTLMGSQGICPDGWHVPTDVEWKNLEGTVDSQYPVGDPEWDKIPDYRGYDVGLLLKASTGWLNNGNGSDLFGFSVLAGGLWRPYQYLRKGEYAYFWTSTRHTLQSRSINRQFQYSYDLSGRWDRLASQYGYSVRCIQGENSTNYPPVPPENPVPPTGSIDINIELILQWSCSDPDGDTLDYKVYFGTDTDPTAVTAWKPDTSYVPYPLDYATTYYWKIAARDAEHFYITEGPLWSFTTKEDPCGTPIIDVRDGKSYNTILIGNQCWMVENLNYGSAINGNQPMEDNGIPEKYCFENISSNCDTYGGLYQWNEAMQYLSHSGYQGLCPNGWHVPSDNEWCTLEKYLDPTISCDTFGFRGTDGGGKMKEAGTAHWQTPNTGATNSSGFTGLPGGFRDISTGFSNLGESGNWWTSDNLYHNDILFRELTYNSTQVNRNFINPEIAFSIRCVRGYYVSAPYIKTYGGTNEDVPSDIILTTDGGIAMTGYTESFGAGMEDGMIIKTDENGSFQWANAYGWSGEGYFNALTQTNDDGFIAAGYHYNYNLDNYDMNFFRTEEDGDQIWAVLYDIGGNEVINDVIRDSNGDIVAVGYQDANTFGLEDGTRLKMDMDHNIIWSWNGGGQDSDILTGVVETVDGGYAVCGHTKSFGNGWYDMNFNLLNSAGEFIKGYTYGGTDQDYAYDLCSTSDSGFVLVGSTYSFGAGGSDIYYRKVDSVGNTVWAYTYGYESSDNGRSVIETSDNCIVIWGDTYDSGHGFAQNFWLIKLTKDGGQILWQTIVDIITDYAVAIAQGDDDCYYALGKTYSYDGNWDFVLLKFTPDGSTCMINDNKKGFKELPEGSMIQQFIGDNAIISPVLLDVKSIPAKFNTSNENNPKKTIQPSEVVTPVTPTVNTICEW